MAPKKSAQVQPKTTAKSDHDDNGRGGDLDAAAVAAADEAAKDIDPADIPEPGEPALEAPYEAADTDGPIKTDEATMPAMDAFQPGAPGTSNAPANLAKQAEAKKLAMIPRPDADRDGVPISHAADSNLAPGRGTGPDGLLAPGDVNVRASAESTRTGVIDS